MAEFNLDEFIRAARDAAVSNRPTKATVALMKETFADPGGVAASIGKFDKDDEVLFEDQTVSIWHVRFQPGVLVPRTIISSRRSPAYTKGPRKTVCTAPGNPASAT